MTANDIELNIEPQRPGAIVDLDQVRNVPLWLATLAGLGAVLAVGNLVASEAARRRRDFALLKSIGFSRRDVRRAVRWHATTVAVVTVAVAVPLGVVVGRVAWRFVAHTIGVSPVPTTPPLLFLPSSRWPCSSPTSWRPCPGASPPAPASPRRFGPSRDQRFAASSPSISPRGTASTWFRLARIRHRVRQPPVTVSSRTEFEGEPGAGVYAAGTGRNTSTPDDTNCCGRQVKIE